MQFCLINNPRSGHGRAQTVTEGLIHAAEQRGHRAVSFSVDTPLSILEPEVAQSDRVVIVGGDGSVHHCLGLLARSQTPMYHCGTGTANLIMREFGMSRSPARVLADLEQDHPPMMVDLPSCNGMPFLIMVSIGVDASVIHRFEERRTSGGYRAYTVPLLRELIHPRTACWTLCRLEHPEESPISGHGALIIANMRSYAGGFNPCPEARVDDSKLDAGWIGATTSIGFGLGLLARRLHIASRPGVIGSRFDIEVDQPDGACIQIDGEKPMHLPDTQGGMLAPGEKLLFSIGQIKVPIHTPPGSAELI